MFGPNIKGSFGLTQRGIFAEAWQCFDGVPDESEQHVSFTDVGLEAQYRGISIDMSTKSAIFKTGDKLQIPALSALPCIRY